MTTIGYTPDIIASGSEGDPSALWNQRISTIPGATRPLVDEMERKLFAGLGASICISRIIRGTPGWWLTPEGGDTVHHVDLVDVVANPGAAFDARNEIINWFEGVVGHPVQVAIRFDVDGDLEVLATDGVEVFVVDERVPGDRAYRMPSEHTAEDIDLLIGSSPVRSSADYCDPISAVRNPKGEMAESIGDTETRTVSLNGRVVELSGLALEVAKAMEVVSREAGEDAFHRGWQGGLGFARNVATENNADIAHVLRRIDKARDGDQEGRTA